MCGDELIDRTRAGDENRDARFAAATGAAHLLPRRRDRSGIARENGRVEAADVDSQLECVRADDAKDIARAQACLDIAPFRWQVTAAVSANALEWTATFTKCLAQTCQQQLDRDACL